MLIGRPPDEWFQKKPNNRKTYPHPFSLRLTFEERAILEKAAGSMSLGAYIRSKLLDEGDVAHRNIYRSKFKRIKERENSEAW